MAIQPMTDTELLEALWLTDLKSYARDQLLIQPMPEKGKIEVGGTPLFPLILNDPQDVLDGIINEIKSEGRLVRLVILKARREGVSTYVSARDYWMTTTRFNRYALLITHEPEATEFIFQMHKRFYQHNPVWKPSTVYNNKKLLQFDTPDGKGLGSAIRVATAGKEDIGSGQAVHYLHLSEMAKWPAHTVEAIMNSVMQCVPQSADTEVVIESTAKGVGGAFHDYYWGSKYFYDVVLKDGKPFVVRRTNDKAEESNEFSSIFLPWYIFPRYQMDVPEGFARTQKEEEMAVAYGLTDRHLVWRRWCIANNCNGSEDTFMQEYPSNAEEAFIGTGSPAFDVIALNKLRKFAPEPIARYSIRIPDGQFIASKDAGELSVWEEPIPGEEYVWGADVSEGISRLASGKVADWSAASCWKCSTGEQVAEWHGKIDPDLFGTVLYHLGTRYNMAYLVPERNNHGNMTVTQIMRMGYPRIYVERVPEPPNKIRKRFGWLTTRSNKGDIVDNMIAELRDGTHGIKSRELFSEMISFKKDGDKYGAETGKFDDRVMAAMIGKFTMPTLKSRRYRRDNPVMVSEPTAETPPVAAWVV